MVNVLASQLRLKMPAASQYISLSNLQSLTTGLAYGYNPIFAAFALISLAGAVYMVYRTRSPRYLFLSLNTLLALSTFVISTTYIAASFPGAASFFFSGVIRATHTSLPSFIGFGGIYRRLRPKRVVGLMLVLIIAGSTQIPTLTAAFQKSLSVEPVDRVSLSYRAPYYRLYLLAKDAGKTLVIGGMHMRGIRMYMAMLPNVVLIGPPKDNATLQALLDQGWDAVFLYDDWITIKVPSMIHGYPQFYQNILTTGHYPGYTIETIWIDGESYALKMVKVNGASDVSDEMRISIMSGQTCAARVAGQNKDSTTCPAIGRYKLAPIEETPIQMRMGSPSFE